MTFGRLLVALAVLPLLALSASAQRVDTVFVARRAPAKDPTTGTILGVVLPGAGQMYAGKGGEGAALLAVAIAAPLVGAHIESTRPASQRSAGGLSGTQFLSIGVGVAAWAYGWANAAGDAEEYNATAVSPIAFSAPLGRRVSIGLALRY